MLRFPALLPVTLLNGTPTRCLDATNALTYSIQSQTVAGAFTINSDTGEITVADGSLLDYETNATHTLTVRVSDGTATYDEAFTISLQNMPFEVQQSIPLLPRMSTKTVR
ncbi:MAG: cadherin repeat domain-containing protein [Pirellulaceae bacterium]